MGASCLLHQAELGLPCLSGAKLFYLSGMKNGKYMKREVLNLARFISVMKFRPLNWRMAHPYLLTDRLEVYPPSSFPFPDASNFHAVKRLLLLIALHTAYAQSCR